MSFQKSKQDFVHLDAHKLYCSDCYYLFLSHPFTSSFYRSFANANLMYTQAMYEMID